MSAAAIYARKSNAQDGVAEEARSVERQVHGARAFIAKQGWTLHEGHVYQDDGVSGALWLKRPEFRRLMRDAAAGAFNAVVFYDLDRFGRNARHTMEALHTLADLGISVWDYSTGQPVDLDSFVGETMAFLRARFDQEEREKARKRVRDAMRRKAELGHVVGGDVFGYDNERMPDGHVERLINKAEAAVVRDIYGRFAAGENPRAIAHTLNQAGILAPRARRGSPHGWSPGTVRAILMRPLYRGVIVYGRTAVKYGRELGKQSAREKGQVPRPEAEWIRLSRPEWGIVDEELAGRVDALLDERRTRHEATLARKDGRAPDKAHGKYLLSGGMLICPTCGRNFEARAWGAPGGVYVCATRRHKPGLCSNSIVLPIREADDLVLSIIEDEILGTRYIAELLTLVDDAPDPTAHLETERDRLRAEVDRLVELVAAGVQESTAAPKIREREAAIARIEVRLREPRPERPSRERLRAALERRTTEWKAALRAEPKIARLVLRKLVGPLIMHTPPPDFLRGAGPGDLPEHLRWEAPVLPSLLDGLVPQAKPPWRSRPARCGAPFPSGREAPPPVPAWGGLFGAPRCRGRACARARFPCRRPGPRSRPAPPPGPRPAGGTPSRRARRPC
ncbi:MAG TPA: recombinase family protein [Vicinamibacteria bacterium]|jgi:site-specific DNA recombinase|nr:recombinase family protein [Vicinamibacteria bacterium]